MNDKARLVYIEAVCAAVTFLDIHALSSLLENLSYYNITNTKDFQRFMRIFSNNNPAPNQYGA